MTYHMGDVHTIDVMRKEIRTQFETIEYDKLIICAGTTNNFFGNNDLIKSVFTMKSAAEATRCRNEILDRLERASLCTDDPRAPTSAAQLCRGGWRPDRSGDSRCYRRAQTLHSRA